MNFATTKLEEERNKSDITFSSRLSAEDLEWFEPAKRIIQQPKNSTAMKQLAKLGYYHVLHDEKIKELLKTVVDNFRKNQRTGVTDSEFKVKDKFANVMFDDE